MPEEQSKKFRTKVGFCHILEDRIVLNRETQIKEGLKLKPSHSMVKFLIIYGLVIAALVYFIKIHLDEGDVAFVIPLCILAVVYLYGWISCFFFSSTAVIYKKDMNNVTFNKGIPGLTRARFIVHFNQENGKTNKRMILMLGVLSGGKKGTKEALEVMKNHGLYPFNKEQLNEI